MPKNVTSWPAINAENRLQQLDFDPAVVLNKLDDDLTLSYVDGVLSLRHQDQSFQSLAIDFCSPQFLYRLKRAAHEQLVKACRIKNQSKIRLLDATAGLGRDAMILQTVGFKVTAYERHPLLAALIADALTRIPADREPFDLQIGDATTVFQSSDFDVIYLDPMFPDSKKSARVKKDMAILQQLHQHTSDDSHELFKAAWQASCQRLVVKRPQKSATLSDAKPTFQINGKTCRFDVYQRA